MTELTRAACCTENARAHCGECPGFPCAGYREWTVGQAHHQAAMEALLAQRDQRNAD